MANIRNIFTHLEARFQNIIEGSIARVFPGSDTPHDLALRLESAMRSQIIRDAQGAAIAPNLFLFQVHPQHLENLQADAALPENLAQALYDVGSEAGLKFLTHPVVRLVAGADLSWGEITVVARHSQENLLETSAMLAPSVEALAENPENAFLIVDGTRLFPISQAVINIGRRSDNQLVLDDERISRIHAQLRLVKGNFVIFDLDSLGGTWVNGERVQQRILQPGDVISLAGLPLVFGFDQGGRDETQEYHP
jgi:hypothetical protein